MSGAPIPPGQVNRDLAIDEIAALAQRYRRELDRVKRELAPAEFGWYPYGTLDNFSTLRRLLKGDHRTLFRLMGDEPFADIGAADGDTAFFLEHCGFKGEVIDHPPTNFNSCRGLHVLKSALRSSVAINEVDLDAGAWRPATRYGLVFFLGILYHLKNPLLVLESLAASCRHALLSTRIARYNVARRAAVEGGVNLVRAEVRTMPIAYLVDTHETNNDPTNFWMFSEAGLRRVLDRAGFEVLAFLTVGNTVDSDPATAQGDERAYALLRSRCI